MSVIMTAASCLFILLATAKVSAGLATAVDIAALIQERVSTEYSEHLCGSAWAAVTNFEHARDVLSRLEPDLASVYEQREQELSSFIDDLACDEQDMNLHQQSDGRTPFDFPNTVYRLPWARKGENRG